MRRTIEALAETRRLKEEELARTADAIRSEINDDSLVRRSSLLDEALARVEGSVPALEPGAAAKKSLFKRGAADRSRAGLDGGLVYALEELKGLFDRHVRETRKSISSLLDLVAKQAALMDARDREWDALGSNHVGMIFKSMEWRVDKLAAETEDVQLLMKKFLTLREKLDSLIRTLDEHKTPAPADVHTLLEPLEDGRYAGFENRFRGSEEEIRRQQAGYIASFPPGGKVLDLGCGRGEFLDLLREKGIEGEGVDQNGQMIDICLDKGLNCRKGDLLERLSAEADGSLSGIFSSQVVEHLPPAYLKRLVEVAFIKLRPGGVIVLETVNPVSVFALVQIYFLDLSHRQPLHPRALQFLIESAGFRNVEIRYAAPLDKERLRELPGADEKTALMNRNIDQLNDLLFAPPNYAVLGKKE